MLKHALAVVVAAALVGAGRGEDYTLKFKSSPEKGQTFVVKDKDTSNSDTKVEVNGMTIPETKKEVKDVEYELRVVKPGDKKPEEFTRTYTKATKSEGNKSTKLPYDGRTLVFTLNKDAYKVSAEGTPAIGEKELAALAKEAKDPNDLDEILDPGKPVKVGDTWNPDKKKLEGFFGKESLGTLDLDKSKISSKLVKVYDKDKHKWGTLELTMEVVIKELSGAGAALKFSEPAVVKLSMTIDRPIDGSSAALAATGKMSMTFKGTVEQGGMTINVSSDVKGDLERSMTEKK